MVPRIVSKVEAARLANVDADEDSRPAYVDLMDLPT